MAVVKVIELVGTSSKSWQDAANQAIEEASQSLRHITGVDVVHQTAKVQDGKISEYRTTLNVAKFFMASTTGFQAGVVSMTACSFRGARSVVSPAQTAPSWRANARTDSSRAKTYTSLCGNMP